MSDRYSMRLSDEEVDRLVAQLAAAVAPPLDAAGRLLDELVPLARRARADDERRSGTLRRILGHELVGGRDRHGPAASPVLRRRAGLVVLLAALLAVVLAASFLLGGGGSVPPTPSAPALLAPLGYAGGGTIAFTRHDGPVDSVWLINPDGSNQQLLAGGGCCALFSPDGIELAVGLPGAQPGGGSDAGVQVFDTRRGTPQFTVPSVCGACGFPPYYPDAWSPNGQLIAVDMRASSSADDGLAIAGRTTNASTWVWGHTQLTGAQIDVPLAFSPDSSQLLFMRQQEVRGSVSIGPLFVLDVARSYDIGSNDRQLTPAGVLVETSGLMGSPASWTRDGRSIVFAGIDRRSGTERTSIFELDLASSTLKTLVADAPGASSARLSPNGAWIAFDRSADRSRDLILVHPDGSGERNLTATFVPSVCCAQWSPDGRALVVAGTSSDDAHTTLLVVAADGSGIWQVTDEPSAYSRFGWGPANR